MTEEKLKNESDGSIAPAIVRAERAGALSSQGGFVAPAVIAAAGPEVTKRYFEFFTVTIRNAHTRSSYFRACRVFYEWCGARGLSLQNIEPIHVAAYVESRATSGDPEWQLGKTSIKQHASAIRMMFSYFTEKGVLTYIRRARSRPRRSGATSEKPRPTRSRTSRSF